MPKHTYTRKKTIYFEPFLSEILNLNFFIIKKFEFKNNLK